jgi:hypothetical protein
VGGQGATGSAAGRRRHRDGPQGPQARELAGRAAVTGARVVRREGYRFHAGDALVGADGWRAWSYRVKVPRGRPWLRALEGVSPVGVVLHLADVREDATLVLEPRGPGLARAVVPLQGVLEGRPARLWKGQVTVRRVSTATPVPSGKTEDDFPAAAYGPDGTLWVAYISYTVRDEKRRVEYMAIPTPPKNFRAFYTPEFADQLFVRPYRGGKWGAPVAVTGPGEDLTRCAVAVEGNGTVWVLYSAGRRGNFDLYARPLVPQGGAGAEPRLGPEKRLTRNPGPDLAPVLCTGPDGHLYGTYQAWRKEGGPRDGSATTGRWLRCRDGRWDTWERPGQGAGGGNEWYPCVAAGPRGCAVAHDVYQAGDYDVRLDEWDGKGAASGRTVAGSDRFEARPSAVYDAAGRLWVAYEEGPEHWGKDYGAFSAKGSPVYKDRGVRVVCLQGGKLFRPAAPPTPARVWRKTCYAHPQLGIDGKGRLWLTYRQNFGVARTTPFGPYWLTFARRLDGDRWSEPVEIHHSDGMLDQRPVLLPHKAGGLLVVHGADGRCSAPEQVRSRVYLNYVDLPGEPAEPKLVPHEPGARGAATARQAAEERAAIKRMRAYRLEAGGRAYRLLRGEFHRHTDVSYDGGADGSLEDMVRYAVDAAGLDWVGNGDHDNGRGREYPWWLTQQLGDAYHVPGSFTPMFSYERGIKYPNGHRNCLFAKRGVMTLPRLKPLEEDADEDEAAPQDTKMLYRYLKELGGICAAHTSATRMGTDWRIHDAEAEPVVEIYQGERMSYEAEGAPRAGYEPKSGRLPANLGGWYPKGFVSRALEKGYRLGFQASSDHHSTHMAYCVVLAERWDRAGILDAVKRRHCYGATDNILLDVRSGQYLMGDEFRAAGAPALQVHAVGTGRLAKIDVLRDSKVVATLRPDGAAYRGAWTDPAPAAGTHYYYVRVLQEDGEVAWASPMWITRD